MTSLWMMTLCDVINFVVAVCSCTPNLAYKLRILTQRFPAKFKLQTDFFLFIPFFSVPEMVLQSGPWTPPLSKLGFHLL